MINGINDFIAAFCQRKDIALSVLWQSKIKVTQLIDDRITTLKCRLSNYCKNNVSQIKYHG